MGDYKQLKVWQVAHGVVKQVYRVTESFPVCERWGLTDQVRRSAVSVPANIAEGAGRNGDAEFARFLRIAMGSANETEYHLFLARDLGYLPATVAEPLERDVSEVKRMLTNLIVRIAKSRHHAPIAPKSRGPTFRSGS